MDPERLNQIVDDAALKKICEEASRDHLVSLSHQSPLSQTPVMGHLASLLTEGILQADTRSGSDNRNRTPGAIHRHVSFWSYV